jgi:DNA (cytosine-5)-methyltransferase 1
MRILDLYCCRGGGAKGYNAVGFEVVGVDKDTQPLYPFDFIQGDAVELMKVLLSGGRIGPSRNSRHYYLSDFVGIHGSPPCQAFTVYGNNSKHIRSDHPNLIPATRSVLEESGLPYVIENVEGARDQLEDPVRICGTGLGVRVRRHRLFETNWWLPGVECEHKRFVDRIFPGSSNRPNGRTVMNVGEYRVPVSVQREVMQMPWSDLYGISQAIPPAYTRHIGRWLKTSIALTTTTAT